MFHRMPCCVCARQLAFAVCCCALVLRHGVWHNARRFSLAVAYILYPNAFHGVVTIIRDVVAVSANNQDNKQRRLSFVVRQIRHDQNMVTGSERRDS